MLRSRRAFHLTCRFGSWRSTHKATFTLLLILLSRRNRAHITATLRIFFHGLLTLSLDHYGNLWYGYRTPTVVLSVFSFVNEVKTVFIHNHVGLICLIVTAYGRLLGDWTHILLMAMPMAVLPLNYQSIIGSRSRNPTDRWVLSRTYQSYSYTGILEMHSWIEQLNKLTLFTVTFSGPLLAFGSVSLLFTCPPEQNLQVFLFWLSHVSSSPNRLL